MEFVVRLSLLLGSVAVWFINGIVSCKIQIIQTLKITWYDNYFTSKESVFLYTKILWEQSEKNLIAKRHFGRNSTNCSHQDRLLKCLQTGGRHLFDDIFKKWVYDSFVKTSLYVTEYNNKFTAN